MNYQPRKITLVPPGSVIEEWISLKMADFMYKAAGPAAGISVYEKRGLTMPARHLMPAWYQSDLFRD